MSFRGIRMRLLLTLLGLLIFVCHAAAQEAQPTNTPSNAPPAAKPIEAGDWASYNYGANGWRYNDAELTLSPDNIKDLELKWRFPKERTELKCGVIHATPAVADGYVYFGTATAPKFYCITPAGEVAWIYDLTVHRKRRGRDIDDSGGHLNPQDGVYTSALITENAVYFGDAAGVMYCLDRVTGQEKWTVDLARRGFSRRP